MGCDSLYANEHILILLRSRTTYLSRSNPSTTLPINSSNQSNGPSLRNASSFTLLRKVQVIPSVSIIRRNSITPHSLSPKVIRSNPISHYLTVASIHLEFSSAAVVYSTACYGAVVVFCLAAHLEEVAGKYTVVALGMIGKVAAPVKEVVGKYIVAALRTRGKAAAQRTRTRVESCILVAGDVRYVN